MGGFTKLVPEIVQSSIWNESPEIRIVWITLLAIKDANGYVRGDVTTIARIANVSLDASRSALERFQEPDPSSHTPDNEGRRIEAAPGGWIILNHLLYREGDRSAYMREYMREYRKNKAENAGEKGVSKNVNVNSKQDSVSASASTSVEGGTGGEEEVGSARTIPPRPEWVTEYSKEIGYPLDGSAWCDVYEVKGWVIGKSGALMKDWKSAVRNWKRNKWTLDADGKSGDKRGDRLQLLEIKEKVKAKEWAIDQIAKKLKSGTLKETSREKYIRERKALRKEVRELKIRAAHVGSAEARKGARANG